MKALTDLGERANKMLAEVGLEKAATILSEGFCPACLNRSVDYPVVDADPDKRTPTSVVNCATCMIRWRAGVNPENGKDWVEHAHGAENMVLTMTINPPPEPDSDDDSWWDEEE